jgi:two-component system, cell cycle sensor histidine kinase and response regulator CckA
MLPLDIQQYRALVENTPTMIWRAGMDRQCDYFNGTWLAFTGRLLEEECGSGWTEGVHQDDLPNCLSIYLDCFERREPFEVEYRLRRFDGVYRYVLDRGVPYSDAAGEFRGFIGSCVDVDDRHANDYFEMSLDNVCVAGIDGFFKRVNPSWTRTLGWTAEELRAKPSVEFVHPEDRAETLAGRGRLGAGSTLGFLTNRYLCKDGSYRWFEWRSVANVGRGLVYAAARDVTEQKLTEERLAEAEEIQEQLQRQLLFADRMASVGTLAAGVAHEINNPLAYVAANITLMIEELQALAVESPSERLKELGAMAMDVQAGGDRIRKIVRGLKTFSRAEEERRVVIDVRPLLDQCIDMAFNEIRHRARLVKDYGKIPLVEADDARLGQVFINLLVNAAQSLPEGDSVANEISVVTSTDAGGRAVIEVRDTGLGIPEDVLGRIFDPFFTTKPVGIGTGLGLSICHNIVAGLGGEISVMSEEGRGTTFRVVLPAARRTIEKSAVPAGMPEQVLACAAVLVVDDEPAIGVVLCRVLRGHQVTVMTTARQALEALASGKHFDVILSDLMMPEMSGMDFYEELARRFPDAAQRVVFVSGGAFTPSAKGFLDRIGNERIEKPFHPQSVRDLIQKYVRQGTR